MNLSENIKKYRKEKGYTQLDLADHVDVSSTSIELWEVGKVMPNLRYVMKMCVVFGITPNDLIL